jgi:hypothetical protein
MVRFCSWSGKNGDSNLVPEAQEGLLSDVPSEDHEAEDVLQRQAPEDVSPSNPARVCGKQGAKRHLVKNI